MTASAPVVSARDLEDFLADAFPATTARYAVELVDDGRVRVRQPPPEQLRPGGTVSGPTLMALADTCMYVMVMSRIGLEPLTVTAHLNIAFLRKPEPAELTGECRLLKLGRRLAVGDVVITTAAHPEPVAHATVTYSIPPWVGSSDG